MINSQLRPTQNLKSFQRRNCSEHENVMSLPFFDHVPHNAQDQVPSVWAKIFALLKHIWVQLLRYFYFIIGKNHRAKPSNPPQSIPFSKRLLEFHLHLSFHISALTGSCRKEFLCTWMGPPIDCKKTLERKLK